MGIVSVRRLWTRGGSEDATGKLTADAEYEVVTDDAQATETDVCNATDPAPGSAGNVLKDVPSFGDALPGSPGCVVCGFDPKTSDETPYIWYVGIKYSSNPYEVTKTAAQDMNGDGESSPTGQSPAHQQRDPTQRNPKWHVGSIDRQEVVSQWILVDGGGKIIYTTPPAWVTATAYVAGNYVRNAGNVYICILPGTSAVAPTGTGTDIADGLVVWDYVATVGEVTSDPEKAIQQAFMNSGKTPFDPSQMIDVSIPSLVVTINVPSITVTKCMKLKNAVNSKRWRGCPPRTAKILKVDAEPMQENEFNFVALTLEIGLDPDTWDLRVLDAGYGAFQVRKTPNPAGGAYIETTEYVTFKDAAGDKFDAPVPLNGRGERLKPDEQPVYLRGVPRQQKLLDFYKEIPWITFQVL